jgi:hypothetical protein
MATTNGYFFTSLALANAKISEINEGEGLPNSGCTTKTYCEALPCVGGYYIIQDEVTSKYCDNLISITNNERIIQ